MEKRKFHEKIEFTNTKPNITDYIDISESQNKSVLLYYEPNNNK